MPPQGPASRTGQVLYLPSHFWVVATRPMFKTLSLSFQTAAEAVGKKVVEGEEGEEGSEELHIEAGVYGGFLFFLPLDLPDWNLERTVEYGRTSIFIVL